MTNIEKKLEIEKTPPQEDLGDTLNQNEMSALVDPRAGYRIAKKLETQFLWSKRELAKYYKNPIAGELTESEKISLTWFLENYYQIEDANNFIEESFSPRSASILPISDLSNEFRIITLAKRYLGEKKQPLPNSLIAFFNKSQKNSKLNLSELWFLSIAFQLIIIETLRAGVATIYQRKLRKSKSQESKDIKYLIKFLTAISKINWKNVVEPISAVEQALAKDPAKIYLKMDFRTRDRYRHIIENIAERSGTSEVAVAQKSLLLSRGADCHIGFFLDGEKRNILEKSLGYRPRRKEALRRIIYINKGLPLFWTITLLSIIFAWFLVLDLTGAAKIFGFLGGVIVLIAAIESIANRILAKLFPPKTLYRMDPDKLKNDLPRTLVVVPTILTKNPGDVDALLSNLELNYLSNKDPNIYFGLALSFGEKKGKIDEPTQKEKESLKRLKSGISALNRRHEGESDIFWLFFRKRSWNDSQELCLEWERKRGKIISLAQALREKNSKDYDDISAPIEVFEKIKYIITLDQGELLTKGAAKKLVATMIHPLNAPEIDPTKKIVKRGYGIIQPLVTPFFNEGGSLFKRMLGNFGWDSYSSPSSNTYQDVFGETVFIGKGIFDVDVFLGLMNKRFPENTVLSHDILEGFYCRTGYAGDIQVFEEEPTSYVSFAQRRERWIRGDWQNIFWLFRSIANRGSSSPNPLEIHQRWRILNNLIRSQVFTSATLLLLLTWFLGTESRVFPLTLVVLIIINTDLVITLFDSIPSRKMITAWRFYTRSFLKILGSTFLNFFFRLVFMFHLSYLSLEAAIKALCRALIFKKKTLEWQAFHLSNRISKSSLRLTLSLMAKSQVLVLFIAVFFLFVKGFGFPFYIMTIWVMAPLISQLFSLERKGKTKTLPEKEIRRLRLVALKTWRFFEEVVSEKTNNLPPDHLSEDRGGKTSDMTSITNIGAYLLSAKAANDLGHISSTEFTSRARKTLESVSGLERHNGHFFNWYSVKTKKSLPPRYISTVDSGNFAASLVTLKKSLEEMTQNLLINQREAFHDNTILMQRGLSNEKISPKKVALLTKRIKEARNINASLALESPVEISESNKILLGLLGKIEAEHHKSVPSQESLRGFSYWLNRNKNLLTKNYNEIMKFYPWVEDPDKKILDYLGDIFPNLSLPNIKSDSKIQKTVLHGNMFSITQKNRIKKYLEIAGQNINRHNASIQKSTNLIEELMNEIDFSFLYDEEKKLFKIGYNLDRKKYDKNYYDLYASEARLASYLAVSCGEVPLEHWSMLGRPLAKYDGRLALISWGGSVFEYFFPQLFLPRKKHTLLDTALKTAFWSHVKYGQQNFIPWGISESSYGQKSKTKDYLYKIHGVPELGLRRVTKKDLVVAPYATFLALEEGPQIAVNNITKLQHAGYEGKYGFYESIDFGRKKEGEIAKTYMSHHQGAIIISITNYLENRVFEKRFMANPEIQAVSYILEEKIPTAAKLRNAYDVKREPRHKLLDKVKIKPEAPYLDAPLVNILSNGRLKTYLSSRGSGFIEYENISLTPFNRDPVLDDTGVFIYISDARSGKVWSSTYQPTLVEPDNYAYYFGDNYIKFERLDSGIASTTEVFMHPKLNAEVRALTLQNKSQQRRSLTVSSYGEVSLAGHEDYWAHPAFQKIKIKPAIRSEDKITFKKTIPKGTHSPVFAHMAFAPRDVARSFEPIIEKSNFFGLGNLGSPDFLNAGPIRNKKAGFESIFAIRSRVVLLPLEKRTLYFVSLYAGREDRYARAVNELGGYDELNKISAKAREETDKTNPEGSKIQKVISLLLYHKPKIKTSFDHVKTAKAAIGINWSWPTVIIEVGQNFTRSFVEESLRILSKVTEKGLKFNILVLTYEKDEYSQVTSTYVDQVISGLDNCRKTEQSLRDRVTIIGAASIENEIQKGLISAASIHWDASKKSLTNLINNDFRKI